MIRCNLLILKTLKFLQIGNQWIKEKNGRFFLEKVELNRFLVSSKCYKLIGAQILRIYKKRPFTFILTKT